MALDRTSGTGARRICSPRAFFDQLQDILLGLLGANWKLLPWAQVLHFVLTLALRDSIIMVVVIEKWGMRVIRQLFKVHCSANCPFLYLPL